MLILFLISFFSAKGYYICDVETCGKFHGFEQKSCFLSWGIIHDVEVNVREGSIKYFGLTHKLKLSGEGIWKMRWYEKTSGGFIKLFNCNDTKKEEAKKEKEIHNSIKEEAKKEKEIQNRIKEEVKKEKEIQNRIKEEAKKEKDTLNRIKEEEKKEEEIKYILIDGSDWGVGKNSRVNSITNLRQNGKTLNCKGGLICDNSKMCKCIF